MLRGTRPLLSNASNLLGGTTKAIVFLGVPVRRFSAGPTSSCAVTTGAQLLTAATSLISERGLLGVVPQRRRRGVR